MTIHVASLMRDPATKKPLSPVDIVMGTPWGEIEPGNSLRLSLLYHVFKKFEEGKGKGGRSSIRARRRRPQSMVKVIRNGGTSNVQGMRAQMTYLSQNGEVDLELSDLYFGAKLEGEEKDELLESWNITSTNKGDHDKTKHIIVSFPGGTDKDAAYRTGRAWAAEMFSSGNYCDVYDYYTAFHTDKDHPHLHIVVNRRGMEHGTWLSIHKDGVFNYEAFRALQVELAEREGIYLEATPRHARGLTDRPIPDAEIRRAEREGRKPEAPSHTPVTAMRAAASIALYAGQYSSDARLIRENHPELAKSLREMAATLLAGQELKPGRANEPTISLEEAKHTSEIIMSRRAEILASIENIDAEIATIPIGSERSMLERDASRIKAEASRRMPNVTDLFIHTREHPDGFYKGIEAQDGKEREIKDAANEQVGAFAKSAGIDPERLVARYDRATPAAIGLADGWRRDEMEDIQKNLTYRPDTPKSKVEELTQAAYEDLHRNALSTYRKAERDLEAHANRKKELQRIARLIREGRTLEENQEKDFRKTVKETLTTSEIRELEAGQSKVFYNVSRDVDEQRALSRRYLEAERQEADGSRKLQLDTALNKIDRDTDLAAQRAAEQSRKTKDRGLDR